MNLHEGNKIKMYGTTKTELDLHPTEVSSLPALANASIKLGDGISKIWVMDKKFADKSTKQWEAKNNIRNAVIAKTAKIAGNIFVYAHDTQNDDLKAKVQVSEGSLRNMRDADLQTRVQQILDLATGNIAKLADYGVLPADVTELEQLIALFKTAVNNMGSGKADRSSARTALTDYFDEVDVLMANVIDKLMDNFKSSSPQFYNAYQAARVVYDLGGGHASANTPAPAPAAIPAK